MGDAIRMLNFKDEHEFEEKDGDDEETFTEGLSVEVVDNGWIVRANDSEGEEWTQVYQTSQGKDMLDALATALGVNNA